MVYRNLGDEMESAQDLLLKRPGAVFPLRGAITDLEDLGFGQRFSP